MTVRGGGIGEEVGEVKVVDEKVVGKMETQMMWMEDVKSEEVVKEEYDVRLIGRCNVRRWMELRNRRLR